MNVNFDCKSRIKNFGNLLLISTGGPVSVGLVTATGVAASALSMLSLGLNKKCNSVADMLDYAQNFVPILHMAVLRVINPAAEQEEAIDCKGFLTRALAVPLRTYGKALSQSDDSFLKRHVFSRLLYASSAIVAAVTRTADLIFSVPSVLVSLLMCGSLPKANSIAMNQLGFLGVIGDICIGLRGFVNPQQFNDPEAFPAEIIEVGPEEFGHGSKTGVLG